MTGFMTFVRALLVLVLLFVIAMFGAHIEGRINIASENVREYSELYKKLDNKVITLTAEYNETTL